MELGDALARCLSEEVSSRPAVYPKPTDHLGCPGSILVRGGVYAFGQESLEPPPLLPLSTTSTSRARHSAVPNSWNATESNVEQK